jgi:hypothetical protein
MATDWTSAQAGGDFEDGADDINAAAVAAYRTSIEMGRPLSERKLAQMFAKTSRRWARKPHGRGQARIAANGQLPSHDFGIAFLKDAIGLRAAGTHRLRWNLRSLCQVGSVGQQSDSAYMLAQPDRR